MENDDDDDEEIDSETEARLYAQIYHAPLELNYFPVTNFADDFQRQQSNFAEFKSDSDVIDLSATSDVEFPKSCNQCPPPLICISSGNSDSESSSSSASSLCSESVFNAADVNLHIMPSKVAKSEEVFHESTASTSFDAVYMLENFSVSLIKKNLPVNPELWKICNEDSFPLTHRMSVGRYYRRVHCKRCNEMGHRAADCPTPNVRKVCFVCGDKKHPGFRCPLRACLICFNFGHFTQQCAYSGRKIDNFHCKRCDCVGHSLDDCPDNWRQFHSTLKIAEFRKGSESGEKVPSRNAKFCFNCGRFGHLGNDCQKPTAYGNRIYPFNCKVHRYKNKSDMFSFQDFEQEPEHLESFVQEKPSVVSKKKERNTKRNENRVDSIESEYGFNKWKKNTFSLGRQNFDQLMKKNRNNNKKERRKMAKMKTKPKKVLKEAKVSNKERNFVATNVTFEKRGKKRKRKAGRKNFHNASADYDDVAVNNVFLGLDSNGYGSRTVNDANNNNKKSKFRNADFSPPKKITKYSWDISPDCVAGSGNGWFG